MGMHGILRGRLRYIQSNLMTKGRAPVDQRGRHDKRPNKLPDEIKKYKLPDEIKNIIICHIKSFKTRQSHYSRRDNPNRYYLDETLSVQKMHNMFLEIYQIQVPYKAYWSVFHTEFIIHFGILRSDTCTKCDEFAVKISAAIPGSEEYRQFSTEKELHQRQAECFFSLKRKWKLKARAGEATVITFDFMQNLPLPHLQTNIIFYSRQLWYYWYYIFGIHDLSTDAAAMYSYHEGVGRKGQNEVTSMLLHYFNNYCGDLKDLVIFSDGCPGQNKNDVMLYFLYILVHGLNIFRSVTYIFPVRGHSFLPNDQDFALITKNKKNVQVQVPTDWDDLMKNSRKNPIPFDIVNVNTSMLLNIKDGVNQYFLKSPKPPVKLKGLKMYKIVHDTPIVKVRDMHSGPWRSVIIRNKKPLRNDFTFDILNVGGIAIHESKMKDIKKLYCVLNPESRKFYDSLITEDNNVSDIDESDNSSADEN